ncbi:MAG: adenylate kinase [Dehalococcoidia bacterium]|nr:adenylate kinase [Dehalococcoidia bacterium]
MNLILLGAPGAGKGTQAAYLSAEFGIAHIASGDLFRKYAAQGTKLGLEAKSYMDKGQLVPNPITINMILERVADKDCAAGFLLDGFPRNIEQAEALDAALKKTGKIIDRVVYIKVSNDELLKRLSGRWICRDCQTPYHEVNNPPKTKGKCDKCSGELYQRDDDKPATIQNRLVEFNKQTEPLIEYYTKKGNLVEVNGTQTPEKVWLDIKAMVS